MRALRFAVILLAAAAALEPAAAQPILRVPGDAADLQQAINRIADGGVIELAAGTYAAPAGGFRIANLRKGFTVRAAPGARATLDGGGSTTILAFKNSDPGRGRPVTFERLDFRNGFADAEAVAGAVTLVAAEATFLDCDFEDNRLAAPTTGGGAMSVADGSVVEILGGAFRRNHALTRGGALAVRFAAVTVRGTRFVANRVNLPGHVTNAVGGAIHILDGTATVSDSVFQRNQAAWVGGAIVVFGVFEGSPTVPRSLATIVRSTFDGNFAQPDPCCPVPGPTGSGAIHVEDQATLRVIGSRFTGNRGFFGGAIGSFRAILEIDGSVFQDNLASEPGTPLAFGGAIAILSSSLPETGPVNRRTAELTVRDSLFQGRLDGSAAAATGGCVTAIGDRATLDAGGGLAVNRAPVALERVAFFGCRGEKLTGGPAFGGGLSVDLVDLTADRTFFLDNEIVGPVSAGGGLAVIRESVAALERPVFAGNEAGRFGGGAFLDTGSRLDISGGLFLENEISPGDAEPANESRGAAIFTIAPASPSGPGRSGDVTGEIADSLFASNVGIEIREVQPAGGERNEVVYNGNSFFSTSFGQLVYGHNLAAPAPINVAGLNALVVPGAPPIDKSTRPNNQLFSRPRAGDLLMIPAAGAEGARSPAYAAFAWSGNNATLVTPGAGDGLVLPRDEQLAGRHGVVELPGALPGRYALVVDGVEVAAGTLPDEPPPLPPGPFLSAADLPDFRFKVEIVAGGNAIRGIQETGCIAETVCVSGALAGRSEVFMRVVGPKPNGFLQPTLVKFSTSRIRIWIEQVSSGIVKFYELQPVAPGGERLSILDGLIDRTGFLPADAFGTARRIPASSRVRIAGLDALAALTARGAPSVLGAKNGEDPPPPAGGAMTSTEVPGFRFFVRITAGGSERLGRKESRCIEETLCVSGAIPGRSEVFLRVVGPKPNGFLQPTIVTFSTSTLEIWIERISDQLVRYYRLEGVGPGSEGGLDGLIDREGFLP